VRFRVDGQILRTVRKPDAHGQFVTRIDATRLSGGRHRLTARIVFKNARRRSRVVSLPFRRCGHKCASRRSFHIRIPVPAGDQLASATVYVNGKRTKVTRGHRLTARVTLTGLPKGTYTVRVRARTRSGRTITSTRRYRTCTLKPARRR
jgi:hypothetical protein